MQLLHVPSSFCLSFQNVKTHEEAGLPSYEKPLQLSSTICCSLQQQRPERSKWASRRGSALSSFTAKAASLEDVAGAPAISKGAAESDVLKALSQIIDPDFGTDIVSCGFVKDLDINEALGEVSFRLELTTPACPIKDMFEQKANEVVNLLPWVKNVSVTMSAQPARPIYAEQLPAGLQTISNIIAVSSCKGGVGKSTVAVNLAYTLAGMGARVGIFDADVYGPSLPTMVSPENRILVMNPEKKTIIPTEYLGVKLVSFGFAGQGRAIMRGPMVSGVINQLLTTTEWGELDYLVVDMPPGTGDIQLTLCQVVPLTAAVIVTTPQKLAFIDVAKGVRMFSKLKVPCVAVVENMSHFDADGKRYYPFGRGSGSQVVEQFGIPNLFDLPIRPTLSASGDSGTPEVVADPLGEVSKTFQDIGICVVQQCAKIRQQVSTAVTYDKSIKAIRVKVPDSDEAFLLHPATVRRNDRSAQSVDEWTGEQKLQFADVPEDIEPEEIRPMGNYAVSITWPDGFSQSPKPLLQTSNRCRPSSSKMEEAKAAAYYEELTRRGEGAARFKQGLGFSSASTDSENPPTRGSALPYSSSSFLSKFVKASSPKKESELQKQAQIESIQNKLKRKKSDLAEEEEEKQPPRVSHRESKHSRKRSRSRSRERHSRRRSRSRERHRDRDRERERDRDRDRDRDRERRRRRSRSGSDSDGGRRRRGRSRSRSRSPRDRRKERRSRSSSPRERDLEKSKGKMGKERNGAADYSKLIQGYDKMSAAERVKAKMKFQLAETAEKDMTKGMGSGWERFEFNKDAPLDDEEVEVAEDDAALVKHIGRSFRFSAIENKREEKIKTAHDEAMFGSSDNPPSIMIDSEVEAENDIRDSKESEPTSLLSDKVLAKKQGSWRDRIRDKRN